MREANVSVDASGFEAMGIEELVSLGREAGIRNVEELDCRGTGALVQVAVESRFDESRLSALEYVDRWEHVARTDDGHLYVVSFTAPGLPPELAEEAEDLLGTCDPDLGERDATMSLVGPQGTISRAIGEYEAVGAAPELRRLGPYAGRKRLLDELTDRQREVLRTAFNMGYYEVPREVSTAEVAAELDLDPSTVAEHIQRAERNVFTQLL